MSWSPGAPSIWQPGLGEPDNVILVLAHEPGGFVWAGEDHGISPGISLSHEQGAFVWGGEDHAINPGLSLPHEAGSIVWGGQDKPWFESPVWQFITVTDLSKIGFEITLADALVGVIPEIGDLVRAPTFSDDGGPVTVFPDLTFTVGAPTNGVDTLADVLYLDVSANVWHGPQDLTINDPVVLSHEAGSFVWAGGDHDIDVGLSLPHENGTFQWSGEQHELGFQGQLIHTLGSWLLSGELHDLAAGTGLAHEQGAWSWLGDDHSLSVGITLAHEPGVFLLDGLQHSIQVNAGISLDHQSGVWSWVGEDHLLSLAERIGRKPGITSGSVSRSITSD